MSLSKPSTALLFFKMIEVETNFALCLLADILGVKERGEALARLDFVLRTTRFQIPLMRLTNYVLDFLPIFEPEKTEGDPFCF
jgi:hypothetical protein